MTEQALWIRFVNRFDIDELCLSRGDIVDVVEATVRDHGDGRVVFEPRVHLVPDNSGAGHYNILRGHLSRSRTSGVKVVGDFVDNYKLGLPSELALVTLYEADTGAPRAIIDATMITEARTGAMTTVGARHLARHRSAILGHVGARGTAWWNVTMLDDLFDFDEIRVTSRRRQSRDDFAERLSEELDKPVRSVATWQECLDGADILVEASRLTEPEPLFHTEWVGPGAFVVPYGTMSAVELDLLDVMDKVVVDDWREAQSGRFGALRAHVDSGRLTPASLYGELGQIVNGTLPGRTSDSERILLWHRGLSVLDVAVAQMILHRCEQAGLGTMLRYR
jgi:ornithine cyclodeaminase